MSNEAQVFSKPNEIAYFRLATLKGRLKLEAKGMKFRGPSLRKQLAEEFCLSPRAPYEKYIEVCQVRMEVLLADK